MFGRPSVDSWGMFGPGQAGRCARICISGGDAGDIEDTEDRGVTCAGEVETKPRHDENRLEVDDLGNPRLEPEHVTSSSCLPVLFLSYLLTSQGKH
jgi:hypothetical protein